VRVHIVTGHRLLPEPGVPGPGLEVQTRQDGFGTQSVRFGGLFHRMIWAAGANGVPRIGASSFTWKRPTTPPQ
jgi:hypothetical protein